MKKLIALIGLGCAFLVSSPVLAGGQQDKMRGCNKEAKAAGLKGDERMAFMKKCLSKDYQLKPGVAAAAPPAAAAPGSSQDKMKGCGAEAKTKGLKGDERKTFMNACLKG